MLENHFHDLDDNNGRIRLILLILSACGNLIVSEKIVAWSHQRLPFALQSIRDKILSCLFNCWQDSWVLHESCPQQNFCSLTSRNLSTDTTSRLYVEHKSPVQSRISILLPQGTSPQKQTIGCMWNTWVLSTVGFLISRDDNATLLRNQTCRPNWICQVLVLVCERRIIF